MNAPAVPSALARSTDRRQGTRRVAGVDLTRTDLGWEAQGLTFEHVEATPPYWHTRLPDSSTVEARRLDPLVTWLLVNGHLTAGEGS